jgi:hypothetical protein
MRRSFQPAHLGQQSSHGKLTITQRELSQVIGRSRESTTVKREPMLG